MSVPSWILAVFSVVMLLAAEVSAGQLVVARVWTRRGRTGADITVSHLLMGLAMAGLLVPGLDFLPNGGWEVVFAVLTAWFGWRLWREVEGRGAAAVTHGPYASDLVGSAALLYVFAALTGPATAAPKTSMSGMGGMASPPSTGGLPMLQAPTLAPIFALLLVAFTVCDLDRRAGPAQSYSVEGLLVSPAVVKGFRVATGVTVAFILMIMI